MTGEYSYILRNSGSNSLQTFFHLFPTAPFKVCPADAHAKQRVACEQRFLVSTIEQYRAGRVARGMEDGQLVSAKTDGVTLGQQSSYGWLLFADAHAEQVACLLRQPFHQRLVFRTNLHLQLVFSIDCCIAEVMIQMAVRGQEVNGFQLAGLQIVVNGTELLRVISSAVNDDALLRVIAYYVAVFLKRIADEGLDIYHGENLI